MVWLLWSFYLTLVCIRAASAQKAGSQTEVAIHGPAGATLFVDGRPSGKLPRIANLHLAAGPHRFQLSIGKQHAESGLLTLPASRLAELNLTMSRNSLLAVLHVSEGVLLRLGEQDLSESQRAQIRQAVDAGARQEHAVLLGEELGTAKSPGALPQARGSETPLAEATVAEPDEAAYVLAIKLHRTSLKSATAYTLRGELLEPRTGALLAQAEPRWQASDQALLMKQLTLLTRQLLQEAGARVREPPEYKPSPSLRITGTNDQVAANTSLPSALRSEARPAKRQREGLLAAGSVMVAGGLALGGFGTSALLANAQCAEDERGCGQRYNTLGIGAGLLGAGTAVAFAGTIVIALSFGKRFKSPSVQPRENPRVELR